MNPLDDRSSWRQRWSDFLTSGGRATAEDEGFLRLAVLNLVLGTSFFVWLLFLVLNVTGFFAYSGARIVIDLTGLLMAVGVLASLRLGVRVKLVAEVANAFLFAVLLALAIVRSDDPLLITIPLIFPAVTMLLLDDVRKGTLWSLAMILALNATIFFTPEPETTDRRQLLDGALSISVAMVFLAAVVGLYLHNRKQVMSRLRSLSTELAHAASHDQLTGLYNRRTFHEVVARELAQRNRDRRLFAFLLFDIDRFKAYNDTHGHPAGDRLLTRIANAARDVFSRREDLVFRLGGEEFGVVFRAENLDQARDMSVRLLEVVEALAEPAPAGPHEHVTVSAGLFCSAAGGTLNPDEVYRQADAALYQAKSSGRARYEEATACGR